MSKLSPLCDLLGAVTAKTRLTIIVAFVLANSASAQIYITPPIPYSNDSVTILTLAAYSDLCWRLDSSNFEISGDLITCNMFIFDFHDSSSCFQMPIIYKVEHEIGLLPPGNYMVKLQVIEENYGTFDTFSFYENLEVRDECCQDMRGDLNADGTEADILDLNFLVNKIFRSGPVTECNLEADVNSDGSPGDLLDLNFLVNKIFRSGPSPGACY